MLASQNIAIAILFVPMALLITCWDIRYRRIPNELVLLTLIGGLTLNTIFGGSPRVAHKSRGIWSRFRADVFLARLRHYGRRRRQAFLPLSGDRWSLPVLPTLMVVSSHREAFSRFTKMIYARRTVTTLLGVSQVFYGMLPGQKSRASQFGGPQPYAALCGSHLFRQPDSFFVFRA